MFKNQNNNKELTNKEAETIIGPSLKVKGNFHGTGNIIIEGQVDGSVKTDNYLLIGNKATVTASVQAKDAQIGGRVEGDVIIDGYLEILATAQITGDVKAKQISIEKGASFNGQCSMGEAAEKETEKKPD